MTTGTQRQITSPSNMAPFNFSSACLIFWSISLLKMLLMPFYRSTDFEVHRNWLAITYSLPIKDWYYESTSEWTLDYPPFFAWFEFLLAQVAVLFDARMLEVDNLEHASFHTILFQRLSVIATDAFLFFAIVYFIQSPSSSTSSSTSSSASSAQLSSSSPSSPSSPLQTAPSPSPKGYCLLLLAFANPGLLLVDHVHFQYNGMMIGLFLLSAALILRGRDLAAGIAFAVLLNFKHIFLQSALVYFTYLLAHYCFVYPSPSSSSSSSSSSAASRPSPSFSVARLVTMGLCVVAVFCVSFLPFCLAGGGLEGMLQIFRRMFPFGERGLCHAYWAPNVWALYNVVDKALAKTASVLAQTVSAGRLPPFVSSTVLLFFPSAPPSATLPSMTGGLVHNIQHAFLPSVQPMHTILLTLLCTLPALWKLWRRPHPLLFPPVLVYATLTFFMCGWHVHEKAILVVLLPLALLALDNLHTARTYLFMSLLAHFSLFPLFFEPREAPIKLLLTLAYTIVCVLALGHYTQHLQHLKQTNRGPGAKEASSRYLGVLTLWEALYLSLTIPIQVFTSLLHPLLPSLGLPPLEFLPLLVTSVYCALGMVYAWYRTYLGICLTEKQLVEGAHAHAHAHAHAE